MRPMFGDEPANLKLRRALSDRPSSLATFPDTEGVPSKGFPYVSRRYDLSLERYVSLPECLEERSREADFNRSDLAREWLSWHEPPPLQSCLPPEEPLEEEVEEVHWDHDRYYDSSGAWVWYEEAEWYEEDSSSSSDVDVPIIYQRDVAREAEAEAYRRRRDINDKGLWKAIHPSSTSLVGWQRAQQQPPSAPPIHQHQSSTTQTFHGTITQTTTTGQAFVSFPGVQLTAPTFPALALPALPASQQQATSYWFGYHQPTQSSDWHSAEWEPQWHTAAWDADVARGAEWEESSKWAASQWDRHEDPSGPYTLGEPVSNYGAQKAAPAPKCKAAPSPLASAHEAPSPLPEHHRGVDPLTDQLAREVAAHFKDPRNWVGDFVAGLGGDFGGIHVHFDGSILEFYLRSTSTGRLDKVSALYLRMQGNLQQNTATDTCGTPRTLGQVIYDDHNEVISVAKSPWKGITYEQAAQQFPDDCDDIIESVESGMHRQQIRMRVYLTLRRLLLFEFRRLRIELKRQGKNYVRSLD